MVQKPRTTFYGRGEDEPSVLYLLATIAIWLLVMCGLRSCVEMQPPNTIEEASKTLRAPLEPR